MWKVHRIITSAKSLASGWSPLAKEILPASTTAIWTLPPLPITWLDLNREAWSTTVAVLLRFYSFCKMYFSLGTLSQRVWFTPPSDRPRNGKLVFDASMQGRSQNQTKNFAYLQMCTLCPCHVTLVTRPLSLVLHSSKILSQQPLWNLQPLQTFDSPIFLEWSESSSCIFKRMYRLYLLLWNLFINNTFKILFLLLFISLTPFQLGVER